MSAMKANYEAKRETYVKQYKEIQEAQATAVANMHRLEAAIAVINQLIEELPEESEPVTLTDIIESSEAHNAT